MSPKGGKESKMGKSYLYRESKLYFPLLAGQVIEAGREYEVRSKSMFFPPLTSSQFFYFLPSFLYFVTFFMYCLTANNFLPKPNAQNLFTSRDSPFLYLSTGETLLKLPSFPQVEVHLTGVCLKSKVS
jgi:hypothetical protein